MIFGNIDIYLVQNDRTLLFETFHVQQWPFSWMFQRLNEPLREILHARFRVHPDNTGPWWWRDHEYQTYHILWVCAVDDFVRNKNQVISEWIGTVNWGDVYWRRKNYSNDAIDKLKKQNYDTTSMCLFIKRGERERTEEKNKRMVFIQIHWELYTLNVIRPSKRNGSLEKSSKQ